MPDTQRRDDPLLAIPPDVYIRRLLGMEVPRHRKVQCPRLVLLRALPAWRHDQRPGRTAALRDLLGR